MILKNNTKRIITVFFQGNKKIIYPNQTIDGPIQLSIYGLTPIKETTFVKTYENTVVPVSINSKNEIITLNNKVIDDTKKYIQNYNKKNIPSVAICILSKDAYTLISDCLISIEKFVMYPNTKIYVFDTGTTDPLTLKFYEERTKNSKFPFKVINIGAYHFSKNYNDGLKFVDSDYYLIQNNDTIALTDYVSNLMKVAILDKVGISGPRMLYKDGLIQHDGQVIYNHEAKGFGAPTHVNLRVHPNQVDNGRYLTDGITFAGALIRSSIYKEIGGLNEKYNDIFQDVEFNIKVRMNNKIAVCDRMSLIHHYDNTSRNLYWENNPHKQKLKHFDHQYIYHRFGNELKYKERPKKKLSIITLVNNESQYNDFLDDLIDQDCKFEFEIIALPNFNNEYKSCAEALNIGLDISESEYVLMCHQDIRVPKNWLDNIFEYVKLFISNDVKFGVLGMAGAWAENNEDGVMYLLNKDKNNVPMHSNYENTPFAKFAKVQCLDELCLFARKSSIRFDENNFNGYHCYGSDFCLSHIDKGLFNFAINVPCLHLSDGFKNISHKEGLDDYLNSSFKLFKKWREKIHDFRNLTSRFYYSSNSIRFFVANELNKQGIKLQETVVLKD